MTVMLQSRSYNCARDNMLQASLAMPSGGRPWSCDVSDVTLKAYGQS